MRRGEEIRGRLDHGELGEFFSRLIDQSRTITTDRFMHIEQPCEISNTCKKFKKINYTVRAS